MMDEDLALRLERLEMLAAGELRREASPGVPGLMGASDQARLAALWSPSSLLVYSAGDIFNATAIAGATWTNVGANNAFVVETATEIVEVELLLTLSVTAAAATNLMGRLVFNSASTPVVIPMPGALVPSAGAFGVLAGRTLKLPAGTLPTGAATVVYQMHASGACTAYLRCATQPTNENMAMRLWRVSA